jgi:hypothetical protein
MRIARVFPRRTAATPVDELAFTGPPPALFPPDVDVVHISVTFTWDLPHAEWLARQWEPVAPVHIGGPATGMRGDNFDAGRYLKPGYVITSRGCPNRCWFCSVWRREGDVRELPIRSGWNVLDDNLLACSDAHIRRVFAMLKRHPCRAQFTGGFEARRLQPWHVELLRELRPKQVFFAYDDPAKLDALRRAGAMLLNAGYTTASHQLRCYVLVGYPGDTLQGAELRLRDTVAAGFLPMAMLWRSPRGAKLSTEWRSMQRRWARPAITVAKSQTPTSATSPSQSADPTPSSS